MTEHLSNGQFAKKEVTAADSNKQTDAKGRFVKGSKGGPGRKLGVPNKATRAVREFLAALVDDEATQEAVQERIRKGDAIAFFRALEHVIGKPRETQDVQVTGEMIYRWADGERDSK